MGQFSNWNREADDGELRTALKGSGDTILTVMFNHNDTTDEGPYAGEQNSQPEWLRVSEACRSTSISKAKLYDLINRGLIRSVSLRERGQIKGTRLICADSLRRFLESRATGGEN